MAAGNQQERPHPAEFHILLALTGGNLHGYGIMQAVESASAGTIRLGPGTLYGAIKRLMRAKWIEECPAAANGGVVDPRRRCDYRLTRAGRNAASEEARRLADLVRVAAARGLVTI